MQLEKLQSKLESNFPEYTFTLGKRIYGRCLIAKKNKYSGADIYIKKNGVIIESAIPGMKMRLLLGSGALLLKRYRKDYEEPCLAIYDFLISENVSIKIKR